MTDDPRWVSKHATLAIHAMLMAEHGGPFGVRDERRDSALDNPRNKHAYGEADIFVLAAAYAAAITRNHPFADGNKRVALTLAGVCLELNGRRLEVSEEEAVSAVLALVEKRVNEVEFAEWLRRNSHPASI